MAARPDPTLAPKPFLRTLFFFQTTTSVLGRRVDSDPSRGVDGFSTPRKTDIGRVSRVRGWVRVSLQLSGSPTPSSDTSAGSRTHV